MALGNELKFCPLLSGDSLLPLFSSELSCPQLFFLCRLDSWCSLGLHPLHSLCDSLLTPATLPLFPPVERTRNWTRRVYVGDVTQSVSQNRRWKTTFHFAKVNFFDDKKDNPVPRVKRN